MKYLIYKKFKSTIYEPIIFPEHVNHCDILIRDSTIISAGFCAIKGGVLNIWGRSDSLNIDSNPAVDKILLRNLINNFGIYGFFEQEDGDLRYT